MTEFSIERIGRIQIEDLHSLSAALLDTKKEDELGFHGLGDLNVSPSQWFQWRERELENGISVSIAGWNSTGLLLGEAGLTFCGDRCAHLNYWVRHSARRQGVGTKLASAVCTYGFDRLKLSRILVSINSKNLSSLALAKKLSAAPIMQTDEFPYYQNNDTDIIYMIAKNTSN